MKPRDPEQLLPLKPANIKLRPDGTVKILDAGLAKASENPVAIPATGLLRVSAAGSEPAVLTRPNQAADGRDHIWPDMLRDGGRRGGRGARSPTPHSADR